MTKPLFIAFEGIDGCGKTTQLERLAMRLAADKVDYVTCRAIGGSKLGDEVRKIFLHGPDMTALSEFLLMSACVAQMIAEVVRPALAEGKWVLCDRWYLSSIAYQGYGKGLDIKTIDRIRKEVCQVFNPDLIVYIQAPIEVCKDRSFIRNKGKIDRFESMGLDFFQRVEKGFEVTASFFSPNIKRIDGTAPASIVARDIWNAISETPRV